LYALLTPTLTPTRRNTAWEHQEGIWKGSAPVRTAWHVRLATALLKASVP
jgi:hypothetical protein